MWMIKTVFYAEKLHFLTDTKLFNEQRLAGKLPQHAWGCDSAVRLAHGIPAEEGAVVAYTEFWDATTLPLELRSHCRDIDSFMHTWGECWQTFFCKSQLCYMIKTAPAPWNECAWQELLRRGRSELSLMWLIVDPTSTERVQFRAWTELGKRIPTVRELALLSTDKRAPESIRAEAMQRLNRHT